MDYVQSVWTADNSAFSHQRGELQKAVSDNDASLSSAWELCVLSVDALTTSLSDTSGKKKKQFRDNPGMSKLKMSKLASHPSAFIPVGFIQTGAGIKDAGACPEVKLCVTSHRWL